MYEFRIVQRTSLALTNILHRSQFFRNTIGVRQLIKNILLIARYFNSLRIRMATMGNVKHLQNAKKKLINQDTRISALKKQLVYYKEITETVREPFIILDRDLKVV